MNRSVCILLGFLLLHTVLIGQPHYFEKFFDYQTWGDAFFSVLQDDSVTVAVGGTAANPFKDYGRMSIVNDKGETINDNIYNYSKYAIFDIVDIVKQKSNYYFTGYGYLYVDTVNYFIIRGQFLFGKTDKAGNILLLKDYGDTAITENAMDMVKLNDNKFLLTGAKLYRDSFQYNVPYGQIKLICVDSMGNILWQSEYGNNTWEVGRNSVLTPDGGFLTVGIRQYDSTINRDILLVKFDSLGHAQWEKTYGDSLMDGADRMISCLDGSYLICGYYNLLYSDFTGQSKFKGWVIKVDSVGNVIWEKKYGDSGLFHGEFINLMQTKDSTYWLLGVYSKDYSDIKGWLVHLSNTGDILKEITLSHNSMHETNLYDLDIASNGDLVICGFTYHNDSTYYDAWLLRVDSNGCRTPFCVPYNDQAPAGNALLAHENPNGINEATAGDNGLNIYPNPSTGIIHISYPPLQSEAKLILYNTLGQAVLEKKLAAGSTKLSIDLSTLPRACYVLQVQSVKQVYTGKVLVE